MSDRQCPSCGGFCAKSGCERENTQPDDLADLLASIKSKHERIAELEQDLQESSNALASAHESMALMQAEVERLKAQAPQPAQIPEGWKLVAWRTKETDEKKPKILEDWFYASNPAYIKVHKYKWQPLYAAPSTKEQSNG